MSLSIQSTFKTIRPHAEKLAYSPLPAVLLAITLVLAEFQVNITAIYPKSLILPTLEALLIGTIPFLIYRRLLHSKLAITIASFLAVPMFYDYEPRIAVFGPILKALVPISDDLLIDTLFIVIILGVCGFLGWLANWAALRLKLDSLKAAQFLIVCIVVVFSSTAISVATQLMLLRPQMKPFGSPIAAQNVAQAANRPDIYYIVLEDYASNPTLNDIYKYDNSPFLGYLADNGFKVRNEAHSNYPDTEYSIPATLQMDYLVDIATHFKSAGGTELPARAIFDNPPIVQALKKQGYKYLHIGSWWTDTRVIPSADVNYSEPFKIFGFGMQKTLSEFSSGVLSKSVFGRFLKHGLIINKITVFDMNALSESDIIKYQLKSAGEIAKSPDQGGRFIFIHIISPHPPFIYNADGSTPVYGPGWDDSGASVEEKYVNQLRYINTQTQDMISTIKKNAKQPPVIVLESDEGTQPREMDTADLSTFKITDLPNAKLQQKYGILAAYDLPGASPAELQRLDSPVNTFRVILDHYFGYILKNLPDCSYAANREKQPFKFIDITPRIKASEDPRCATIHK